MGSPILFIILAVIAVAAALGMLLSHNAVHSALFLVLNFATIAVFYIVLNAPFIAMVQVTVYAGAIIVPLLVRDHAFRSRPAAGTGHVKQRRPLAEGFSHRAGVRANRRFHIPIDLWGWIRKSISRNDHDRSRSP